MWKGIGVHFTEEKIRITSDISSETMKGGREYGIFKMTGRKKKYQTKFCIQGNEEK